MNVSILGCGVFGLAIATTLLNNNINVKMWNKFQKEIDNIKDHYKDITFSTNLETTTNNSDLIIIAIPVNGAPA